MQTQFPSQLRKLKALLEDFSIRGLSCNQLHLVIHDEIAHVPVAHFFPESAPLTNEFICWGEKVADNLILSWLVEGKNRDDAPIAMIDSEQSPVAVVAKNPEDFLSMLPYGTVTIGSVAEHCLADWAEAEFTDAYFEALLTQTKMQASNENDFAVTEYINTAKMYGNLHLLERPIEEIRNELLQEGKAFLELLQWYEEKGIEIAKNPFKRIKEAVELYPHFFDRAIALGLPFQKYE